MSDINVTTHISLNPNLTCLIQNFLHYVRCQTAVTSQMQIEKKSISDLSNGSSSMHSYLTYRKNIHNRLSQINNNISNTIIEGCRGIDNICYKVRQCLDESQNIGISKSAYNELSWRSNGREIKRKSEGSTEVSLIESLHEVSKEKIKTSDINEKIAPTATKETTEEATKSWFYQQPKVAKKLSLAKIKRQIQKRNLILEEFRETVMDQIEHNDFEAMEKIVENLNEDIEIFDKKVAETRKASTDDREMFTSEMEVLTTQTIDTQESLQMIKSVDYKFENFEAAYLSKTMPFIIPEVYPKPSITDLHKKLISQLEANDSYLCFQRLMDSHAKLKMPKIRQIITEIPSVSGTSSNRIVADCSSISSVQMKVMRRKKKPHKIIRCDSQSAIGYSRKRDIRESEMKLANVRSDLYAKYSDSLWFSKRYLGKAKSSKSSVKSIRSTKDRHKNKPAPAAVQKDKKKVIKHAPRPMSKCSFCSGGFHSDATICLSRCTTSGYSCNLKINNDLPVSPSTKCHLRWIRVKNEQAPSRKIEYLDILDDLTPKDLLPLQSEYPRRDRQGGVKFFSEFRPKPSKSINDTYLYRLLHEKDAKQATWDHLLKPSIECCNIECSICHGHGASKCDDENKQTPRKNSTISDRASAAQKLLPYMQDPTINVHFQSVTVMPVRVFYDQKKWQTNCRPTPDKTDVSSNSLADQKPHPVAMKEAKGPNKATWVPPDQGSSSKSLRVVYTSHVKQQQQTTINTDHSARREGSRILIKRNSKLLSPKDRKQLEKYIKVQSDIEKKSIEIDEKTPRGLGRKLWANKYGKSVGHQLVSFVKNQPQESKPALPKYALPNGSRDIKNSARHKQMLAHLRGLKEKNDEIQTNIQKAINVIETKMIDILSAPGDSSSVEAFDLMEKEITNVLSLMKFNPKGGSKNSTANTAQKLVPKKIDNLEEDFNSISDQLFQKLEKILDSDLSRATISASDHDNKKEEVQKKKQKSTIQKMSSGSIGDRYQSSSLTSTSLEDTNYERNEKKIIKKSRIGKCPNVERLQLNEEESNNATLEQIEREYATGENCGTSVTKMEIVAKQEHEETDNSRGDCIKDSCENILSSTSLDDNMMNHRLRTPNDLPEDGEKFERSEDDNDEKNHEKSTIDLPVALKSTEKDLRVEECELPSKSESEESDLGLSDQVNKIIKRVEDIYNHLDDIHISNDDQIPVFSEPSEVPGVASQQFLTPFMQAVKEKRSRPATPNIKVLQRSPSYYNVLTFLDTLSAIQQEKPTEVHTARLCYYSQICFLPKVSCRAHIEHTVKTEKTGCLRKHSDEGKSKHKKVSFLVLKDDKSCQASICPHHKFKVLKVSSQQFPSTEDTMETCHTGNAIQVMIRENDLGDERQNIKIYKDHPAKEINFEQTKKFDLESDQSTQVYCQTRIGNSNFNSEKDDVQKISESSTNLILDKPPHIKLFHADTPKLVFNDKGLIGSFSHQTIMMVKNSALTEFRPTPKIVVLREVSEMSRLLQPLKVMEMFSIRDSLIEESGQISSGQLTKIISKTEYENVALLKSCYAFVYIIMFTALNLNYRCA